MKQDDDADSKNESDIEQELITKAQQAKEQGNQFFQEQHYDLAIDSYSKAIDLLFPNSDHIEIKSPQSTQPIDSTETSSTEQPSNDYDSDEQDESTKSSDDSQETQNIQPQRRHEHKPQQKPSLASLIPKGYHSYLSVYYSNRAACYIAESTWELAIQDCTKVLMVRITKHSGLRVRSQIHKSATP
jgi:hypothetical protein